MTDFETLKRPSKPNNFLVCDDTYCKSAKADMAPPEFPFPPGDVATAWDRVIARQPRTDLVQSEAEIDQYTYIQRSALMRFPDKITIRFVPVEGGKKTSLLIWSRSEFGYSDMGVNRKRILQWLSALTDELSATS